jgi:hypothetical protein
MHAVDARTSAERGLAVTRETQQMTSCAPLHLRERRLPAPRRSCRMRRPRIVSLRGAPSLPHAALIAGKHRRCRKPMLRNMPQAPRLRQHQTSY